VTEKILVRASSVISKAADTAATPTSAVRPAERAGRWSAALAAVITGIGSPRGFGRKSVSGNDDMLALFSVILLGV